MKRWYLSREPRERRTLLLGALVLALILLYTLGWQPLVKGIAQQQRSIAAQQETLQWMQGAAAEIALLRGKQTPQQAAHANQPLLSIVESTAKNITRAGGTLKRIEPKGADSVQVWLEQASFDQMILWLNTLQKDSAIHVDTLTIDKQKTEGIVDVRVTLIKGRYR